jgi:hypothetical protein
MLNPFSRRDAQASLVDVVKLQRSIAVAAAKAMAKRPDFDISEYEEPTPTVPGGYWHAQDETEEGGSAAAS